MWEFEIICDLNTQDLIRYIQNRLNETLKKCNGVMALMTDGDKLFLSIGVKIENSPEIKANLRLVLCDVFCEKMKQKFLENNLDLPEKHRNLNDTFIKVFTYFDRELERQIILRKLELKENKINLQSFLYFKLNTLIKKWQELCELANKNTMTILKKENFIELLRFLLQNIDSKCQSVILELQDKCLIYHDNKNDFDIITSIDTSDSFNVLSKLMDLNPYLIKIHSNEQNLEMIKLLRSVFDDRIELS